MKTWFAAMLLFACALAGCQSPPAMSSSGNPMSPSSATNPSSIPAAPAPTSSFSTYQTLMIDPSSMAVEGGNATLTIGTLQRVDGVYNGNYKITVFPWFLKSEKGTLAIIVSDESLAKINQGKMAPITGITGTATTSGKGEHSRPIEAIATPTDINHGNLKLWFMAGDRKMIFEPAYQFTGKNTKAVLAQAVEIQP
jgi:hypothetical protein